MAYTYGRREQLAREKGFASYTQYRKATELARRSPEFQRIVGPDVGGPKGANLDMAKLYYQAFKLGDKDDYSIQTRKGRPIVRIGKDGKPRGAKAKWLIDVAGYVDDASEWRQRYPTGHRE